MKKIFILLLCLGLYGCATMPTQQEIANLDYGSYPTINCQEVIKNYFSDRLFDPYSAVYEFEGEPTQFWFKRPPISGGGLYAGYVVYVNVNAKNRMGGYVGKRRYGFIFKYDEIIQVLEPEDFAFLNIR